MLRATLLAALVVLLAPPSGPVPIGPLQRFEPKVYDVAFEVTLTSETPTFHTGPVQHEQVFDRDDFKIEDTPIVFPIIFRGPYSKVDPDSLEGRMWAGAVEDRTLKSRTRLDANKPFGVQLAVLPIVKFEGENLRWRMAFRTQAWSARIDEAGAQRLTWPAQWPEHVQDGLKPQMFIESDHALFGEFVQKTSGGALRQVAPYLAAKDLVRACINQLRISGDGEERRELESLHGLELKGGLKAAQDGIGGPHDLVCVCVAVLRAAGIPARPVIGVTERADGKNRLVSWAEFYLEGAGWIPFDPEEMRGKGIRTMDVRKPWPEFGTMDDLNDRVPLAYHFHPPVDVVTPEAPALWGWDPRPRMPRGCRQAITLSLVSRGRGQEDPK
jgi:hypothetical protein